MNYEEEVVELLKEDSILHILTGLSAECGEVNGLFQKNLLYANHPITKEALISEIGDVLYYLTALYTKYHLSLKEIQEHNIAKIKSRRGIK